MCPDAVGLPGLRRFPITTASSTAAGFLIALALAAVMLAIFGVGDRGTAIALRATARWSFLLFWLAYAGSAMAKLLAGRLNRLAAHSRDFGLAFASAQLIHVGLVLWLIYLSADPGGTMLVWAGIACTYLLALLSWQRLRDALGPRLWWVGSHDCNGIHRLCFCGRLYPDPAASAWCNELPAELSAVCCHAGGWLRPAHHRVGAGPDRRRLTGRSARS